MPWLLASPSQRLWYLLYRFLSFLELGGFLTHAPHQCAQMIILIDSTTFQSYYECCNLVDPPGGSNSPVMIGYCYVITSQRPERVTQTVHLMKDACGLVVLYCDYIKGPIYKHGVTLTPAWISNCMPSKMWNEIMYPFPNFNGTVVEFWEWISNFIPRFVRDVITYPCWD